MKSYSRPLTYIYGDDIEEPLTPSHLMIGKREACSQKESSVKEGDVVIVKDEKRPRNSWKLGRVKKLVKGRDGSSSSGDCCR